jgi:hypothetical protein
MTFNIPKVLQGNESKLREYIENREEGVTKKNNCYGASLKDVMILSNDCCCAIYNLIHTEDW